MEGTLWAIVPPLVAIVLCFVTKNVLLSLFVGIFTGGLLLNSFNPITAVGYSLEKIVQSIADEWSVKLLLFNLMMGAGIAFIWKLGGSKALADWARNKIKTRRAAEVWAWLLGIVVFFNDYINAAIVGNVTRDIFEEHKISKEKLAYILDSTAAPVATFFISDWIAYQLAMIQSGLEQAGISDVSPLVAFLKSIPFNFYCIFTIAFVGIIAIGRWDFGAMLKAEYRSQRFGKTSRDGASPMLNVDFELGKPKETKPMIKTFVLPILALIVVTVVGFYYTGAKVGGESLIEILGNSDAATALLWGAFAMTITGVAIALVYKLMDLAETMKTILEGFKLMLLACAILVLAWSIGAVTKDMKLADAVVSTVGEQASFAVVPAIIFLVGMFISFATGTSWGTMAILTPIAIPIAYKITGDAMLSASVMAGVVFAGAIFGDHCSPISDTTVLASIFAGSDHMDHVNTQFPYALTTAFVALVLYLVYGFFKISPFVLLPVGIVLLILIARYLHKRDLSKLKSILERA
ncbi:Na+/H+ antiporter NhaC family protein [Pseudothermotoga thermarum]|uniref:Transporter, NhaC family n=1 Tax=Pseudothermotoga thermarum DSM 5069 TaxID=688269 RepID=F7YV99_9THEM|nr:Na+/H+ antiporter NhaC family protein [Pseudothermotoga thermarum]AEH50402.1 transporter, NhaC family [Pseudothermotoga thermarum DSM 5069]